MAVEAFLPTLSIVTLTAAVDSINPCAIGVLVLMISVLLAKKKSVKEMLALGFLYIAAIFVTYVAAGLGLLYVLSSIPLYVTEYIALGVASLVIIAGVLEIKDFFWYGEGPTLGIPPRISKRLPALSSRTTFLGIIFLGAFVAAVELPCTGAPYLAIIALLSQNFNMTAFFLLLWYNFIFVAPLIVILGMVAGGVKLQKIKEWKEDNRHYMRLAIGVLLIFMGWLLILTANGTINFA